MQIAIRCLEKEKSCWEKLADGRPLSITWYDAPENIETPSFPIVLDYLFTSKDTETYLKKTSTQQIVLVEGIFPETIERHPSLVYFNSWHTRVPQTLEAGCSDKQSRQRAMKYLATLGIELNWVKNQTGLISPRVISRIINEAWMTFDEGISTKEDIDTAMKLGTNYPYGPFEWCEMIGSYRVFQLLERLSKENARYMPSKILQEQAQNEKM